MEPNPYEPPQSEKPLTRGTLVKRRIGVGMILLLTPLAVGITIACSCAAVNPVMNMQRDMGTGILAGYLVAYVPPAIVLIGMLLWAVLTPLRDP